VIIEFEIIECKRWRRYATAPFTNDKIVYEWDILIPKGDNTYWCFTDKFCTEKGAREWIAEFCDFFGVIPNITVKNISHG